MDLWNSRGAFSGDTIAPQRLERDYDREKLADALVTWSLGSQIPMHDTIAELSVPILWLVGQEDKTYLENAKKLQFKHADSAIMALPGAGHRVPWYAPEGLREVTEQFLDTVSKPWGLCAAELGLLKRVSLYPER